MPQIKMKKIIYVFVILFSVGIMSSCNKLGSGDTGETVGGLTNFTGDWTSTQVYDWDGRTFPVCIEITKETITFYDYPVVGKNKVVKYFIDNKITEFFRQEMKSNGISAPYDIDTMTLMFFYQGELELFEDGSISSFVSDSVSGEEFIVIANYDTNYSDLAKYHMDWYSASSFRHLLSFMK